MKKLISMFQPKPGSVFLASAAPNSLYGRYSLIAEEPFLIFQSKFNRIRITTKTSDSHVIGNPFEILEDLLHTYHDDSLEETPFSPGALGYFSYELGYPLHRMPIHPKDDLQIPDIWLAFYDEILYEDHLVGTIVRVANKHKQPKLSALPDLQTNSREVHSAHNTWDEKSYTEAFNKIMEHIEAGDIYQANLSKKFSTATTQDPWEIFKQLQLDHATPLMGYLDTGEAKIVSASPELFLRKVSQHIETCPIKGTARKGNTNLANQSIQKELKTSSKQQAEHMMIVDLERNDLGRICKTGTIAPQNMMKVEECGDVFHMVTTVSGELRPGVRLQEIFFAMFPGGSITGAPKLKAMEIIGKLEPLVRGIYTGALGWLGFSGNLVLNLPIRTLLFKEGMAHLHVGSGIVSDSTAVGEYQEICSKGEIFLKLLGGSHVNHTTSV